jgi:hypothetical protein
MKNLFLLLLIFNLFSCAPGLKSKKGEEYDKTSVNQFGKNDFDRMADLEFRENMDSLELLMLKLYKRNPNQLKKSTSDNAELMVKWVFHGDHNNNFKDIQNKKDIDALNLVWDNSFKGDRVLALIVGLKTMLLQAHEGKNDFYLFDKIDPQKIYNVARNIEVVVWKLSSKKDIDNNYFLITNSLDETNQNLSFEREFGKIIGRTDYFAYTLSEKTARTITRVFQSVTTRLFLPF